MYVEKRWLAPVTLSLLLLGTFLAIVTLVIGSAASRASGRIVDAKALPIGQTPPCLNSPSSAVPVSAVSAPPTVVPATSSDGGEPSSAASSPEEVVDISTSGSEGTQINTRGFGDVGMQLQNVNVNGPINVVHISNQGNNNSNNVSIGDDNGIVSDQEQLQSNRSDMSAPVTVASTEATAAEIADPEPSAGAGTDTPLAQDAATAPAAATTSP